MWEGGKNLPISLLTGGDAEMVVDTETRQPRLVTGESEDVGFLRKVEGVDVMKDKVVKMEEIESSHTLGGPGEGRFQGRDKWSV